jgi:hypothetical protein
MKRRAYLRTVTLAVPGLLLTGWAPAHAAAVARPVHLVLRDGDRGAGSASLRAGVEFGLDEVAQGARVLHVPLFVHRAGHDLAGAIPCSETAVQVVVADEDDGHPADGALPCGPRIYTCPLREWRPDAWSVASARPGHLTSVPGPDWHAALDTPEATQLNARFARRTGVAMDESAWRGWMAVRVAFETALRADAGEDDLLALRFNGHKGQRLRFSEDGHLVQPTCRLVGGRAVLAPAIDHDLFADVD